MDDEKQVLDAARLMLEHLGHEVVAVTEPRQALERFSEERFDLVFTDYLMPGMRGDDLAQAVKAIRTGQPVAMITAYSDVVLAFPGVDLMVSKPFFLRDLQGAIDRLCPVADSDSAGAGS